MSAVGSWGWYRQGDGSAYGECSDIWEAIAEGVDWDPEDVNFDVGQWAEVDVTEMVDVDDVLEMYREQASQLLEEGDAELRDRAAAVAELNAWAKRHIVPSSAVYLRLVLRPLPIAYYPDEQPDRLLGRWKFGAPAEVGALALITYLDEPCPETGAEGWSATLLHPNGDVDRWRAHSTLLEARDWVLECAREAGR